MIKCTFERGGQVNLRHVVVDAVLVQDHKILLIKRAERLREGGKWALPGGYMDRDETTVEAVMREVLEETGYTCTVEGLLTVLDKPGRSGDDRQNVSFVFTAKPIAQPGKPDDEVTELAWFDLDTLPPAEQIAFDHLEIIWEWVKQNDRQLSEPLDN